MRLFIAIPLNEKEKNRLYSKITSIKSKLTENLKWVEKENMHITLKYIGKIEKLKIKEIKKIIESVSQEIEQQYFSLGNIAAFPNLKYPKVVYITVIDLKKILSLIHQKLEKYLVDFNVNLDKNPYIPHITIGRGKRNNNIKRLSLELNHLIKEITFENNEILMDRITLFNSKLYEKGPLYEELYSSFLMAR